MNNVDILDDAIEAQKPYNINVTKQIVIYFILGVVLAAGILFIIYYFDRTIKSVEKFKLKLLIYGWFNYFKIADMRFLLKGIDENIRRKIRVIIWKQG